MCIKHYTIVGHVGVSVCMSVSLLCCGLSYASTWWTINFWNCGSNIDAKYTCISTLVLSSILFCISIYDWGLHRCQHWIRFTELIGLCTVFLLLIFCVALLADTWYTDPSHYLAYNYCNSWYSGPDIGACAALVAIIICTVCGFVMIFPCSVCVITEGAAMNENILSSRLLSPVTATPLENT